jgi:hypothetical protein
LMEETAARIQDFEHKYDFLKPDKISTDFQS